jgi:hypothetical protein
MDSMSRLPNRYACHRPLLTVLLDFLLTVLLDLAHAAAGVNLLDDGGG